MSESSEEFEKKMLLGTLMKQSELMRNNAHQLEKWYGKYDHHIELLAAAKITDDWVASIRHELEKSSG